MVTDAFSFGERCYDFETEGFSRTLYDDYHLVMGAVRHIAAVHLRGGEGVIWGSGEEDSREERDWGILERKRERMGVGTKGGENGCGDERGRVGNSGEDSTSGEERGREWGSKYS